MDRTDTAGLGVAALGHVALIAALVLGVLGTPDRMPPLRDAMEVGLVDEVALEATAPNASLTPPAPSVAPEIGEVAELPPPTIEPLAPPPPQAVPRPQPKPAQAKPQKPRPQPRVERLRGSRLGANFLNGIGATETPSDSQAPRANIGPAAHSSIAREVLRQLKPHWRAPTGADSEQLRTELSISLGRDGSVTGTPRVIRQTGITDSNRAQARLHQEAAIKAVRLASPFSLPPELYDAWKLLEPVGFDRRLSQ